MDIYTSLELYFADSSREDIEKYMKLYKSIKSRSDRLHFIEKKLGPYGIGSFLYSNDREVKRDFDSLFMLICNKQDYDISSDSQRNKCARCGDTYEKVYYCGCGQNLVVFDEIDWKEQILRGDDKDLSRPDLVEINEEFKKRIRLNKMIGISSKR